MTAKPVKPKPVTTLCWNCGEWVTHAPDKAKVACPRCSNVLVVASQPAAVVRLAGGVNGR